MNIQRKNSAHHFLMQSEREQTLATIYFILDNTSKFILKLIMLLSN